MVLEKYNHQFLLTPAVGFVKEPIDDGHRFYFIISWLCFGLIFSLFELAKIDKQK